MFGQKKVWPGQEKMPPGTLQAIDQFQTRSLHGFPFSAGALRKQRGGLPPVLGGLDLRRQVS